MARPKHNSEDKQAYRRIEDAFWNLLAERPYNKITISALSKEANVNHNLLYYYFDNIDDMAVKFFHKNMEGELPAILISAILGESATTLPEVLSDKEMMQRVSRTRLFMKDNNAYLNSLVKERLLNEWLKAVGVTEKDLTIENRIDLEFIFSGIISVIGSSAFDESPYAIATLYNRALGKGIIETLKGFSK